MKCRGFDSTSYPRRPGRRGAGPTFTPCPTSRGPRTPAAGPCNGSPAGWPTGRRTVAPARPVRRQPVRSGSGWPAGGPAAVRGGGRRRRRQIVSWSARANTAAKSQQHPLQPPPRRDCPTAASSLSLLSLQERQPVPVHGAGTRLGGPRAHGTGTEGPTTRPERVPTLLEVLSAVRSAAAPQRHRFQVRTRTWVRGRCCVRATFDVSGVQPRSNRRVTCSPYPMVNGRGTYRRDLVSCRLHFFSSFNPIVRFGRGQEEKSQKAVAPGR